MDAWRRSVGALSPRQVLAVGFAVLLVYAFPGYMSTDSGQQLVQARTGEFSDAHPPLMGQIWRVLDWFVSGPLLMLLLQGTVFLGALYALFRRVLAPRAAAWTAVAILVFPPVLTPMAVIWKDSQMAAFLLAGTAVVLHPRLAIRIAGLGLLVAASAFRHNALAATVPLVFFLFEWRPGLRWWKRFAILVAAAIVTVGIAFGVTRGLAVHHAKLSPAFSDIVGVIACTEDRSDEDLRYVLRGTRLVAPTEIQRRARALFETGGAWRITMSEDRLFDNPATPEDWQAVERAWQDLVLGDPGAYLAANWHRFALILGWSDEPPRATVWNAFLEGGTKVGAIEHNASHSRVQAWFGRALYWLADETPLFRPYMYALLAFALLVSCCRDRLTAGLFASGLLYELSFFPVGAEPDYRYSHWMITSVCVATVILFVQRRRRGSPAA